MGKVMAELFEDDTNSVTIEGLTIRRQSEMVVGDAGKSYEKKSYTFTVQAEQAVQK